MEKLNLILFNIRFEGISSYFVHKYGKKLNKKKFTNGRADFFYKSANEEKLTMGGYFLFVVSLFLI